MHHNPLINVALVAGRSPKRSRRPSIRSTEPTMQSRPRSPSSRSTPGPGTAVSEHHIEQAAHLDGDDLVLQVHGRRPNNRVQKQRDRNTKQAIAVQRSEQRPLPERPPSGDEADLNVASRRVGKFSAATHRIAGCEDAVGWQSDSENGAILETEQGNLLIPQNADGPDDCAATSVFAAGQRCRGRFMRSLDLAI